MKTMFKVFLFLILGTFYCSSAYTQDLSFNINLNEWISGVKTPFLYGNNPITMTHGTVSPYSQSPFEDLNKTWKKAQQGFVVPKQTVNQVKEHLEAQAQYVNSSSQLKTELDKVFSYFSSPNQQRDAIQDYVPSAFRPTPPAPSVNIEKVASAMDPLWKSAEGKGPFPAEALDEALNNISNLSVSDSGHAKSELFRQWTHPTYQLKNLPYQRVGMMTFNLSTDELKSRPFVNSLNSTLAMESVMLKKVDDLSKMGDMDPGITLRASRAKERNSNLLKAWKVEEFKSKYFSTKSSYPSDLSNYAKSSAELTSNINTAEEFKALDDEQNSSEIHDRAAKILAKNPKISQHIPESEMNPDQRTLSNAAKMSLCIEKNIKCAPIGPSTAQHSQVKNLYGQVESLYEANLKSQNIADPYNRDLSRALIENGHNSVLNSDPDADYYVKVATSATDILAGFTPGVSFAKDVVEAITGHNYITGEELSTFERTFAVVGVMTAGSGSALKSGYKLMTKIASSDALKIFVKGDTGFADALEFGNKIVGTARDLGFATKASLNQYLNVSKHILGGDLNSLSHLDKLVDASKTVDPKLGNKYVRELPELLGSYKEAFDGKIFTGEYHAGEIVFQAQRTGQTNIGNWFLGIKPLNSAHAEELANIQKWGNDASQIRAFRIKENVSGYAGAIAGGSGHQFYIPNDVTLTEILEEVVF